MMNPLRRSDGSRKTQQEFNFGQRETRDARRDDLGPSLGTLILRRRPLSLIITSRPKFPALRGIIEATKPREKGERDTVRSSHEL